MLRIAVSIAILVAACGGQTAVSTETAEPATTLQSASTTTPTPSSTTTTAGATTAPDATSTTATTTPQATASTTGTTTTTARASTTTPPTTTTTTTTTTAAPTTPETETAEIENFRFSPADLTIRVGDTVVWTVTSGTHTATSSGNFDSGSLGTGQSFSYVFDRAGTYSVFCAIHPSMTATVAVAG